MSEQKSAFDIPNKSHIVPGKLTKKDTIQFRCHKDIACFNACCNLADVTLTPYDVIRLKKHLNLDSSAFLKQYTVPFQMDGDGMPGIKLKTDNKGACLLITKEGCSVYKDRPSACRYYALGHMSMKALDSKKPEDYYVLIHEDHCLGHKEDRTLTIEAYRHEQGVESYDQENKEWMDIILKKRSSGPTVGNPPEMSLQLYFMFCFDLDRARRFVSSPSFIATYELDADEMAKLEKDDIALLHFGLRFLKQTLFGEDHGIAMKEGAKEKRIAERKDIIQARIKAETEHKMKTDPRYDPEVQNYLENVDIPVIHAKNKDETAD